MCIYCKTLQRSENIEMTQYERLYWWFCLVLYLNRFHLRSEPSKIVFHLQRLEACAMKYKLFHLYFLP